MSLVAAGCWTAVDNARLYHSSPLDDKDRSKLLKDAGAYSGIFKLDYLRNCTVLGVVPHPALVNRRPRTLAEEEQAEVDEAAAAAGQATPAAITPPAVEEPAAATAAVSPSPPAAASVPGKKGSSTAPVKPGRQSSAEKLTPAQRAAAELAAATAALSPEELKPLQQLQVRGWEVDIGTAAALQLTIPACKSLHTLRFWNASLSPRAITLLHDSLKGSAVTKVYLDYNPLVAEKGQEPGLVYSVLLAPSSPLQVLGLRGNRIDDTIAADIAKTVAASKNLVVLDLFDNLIGDEGARSFARALGLNQTLHSINLGRNRIGDGGAQALAQVFQSVNVPDKEEAKTLKKAGYKITTVKTRTMREANQLVRTLNLAHNYIGEVGLRSWLAVQDEQVKFTPAKGVVLVDGIEVSAASLVPAHLLPPAEKKADESFLPTTPILSSPRSVKPSARNSARSSSDLPIGSPSSAKGSAVDRAAEVAAKAAEKLAAQEKATALAQAKKQATLEKEEEEMRYPGQLNCLQQVDLTKQYSRTTELTWHQLAHATLLRWTTDDHEQWDPDGTCDVRAIDAERAANAEAERVAAQTEEERGAEAAAKAEEAAQLVKEREESAVAAAEAAAQAAKEKDAKKAARKERSSSKKGGE